MKHRVLIREVVDQGRDIVIVPEAGQIRLTNPGFPLESGMEVEVEIPNLPTRGQSVTASSVKVVGNDEPHKPTLVERGLAAVGIGSSQSKPPKATTTKDW